MRITLVRHGETTQNQTRTWQGHAAGSLSPVGEEQAAALGRRLAGQEFDVVVTSDLERAQHTAEIAGFAAEPDKSWREIDVGDWAGRTHQQVWDEDRSTVEAMRKGHDVQLGGTGETVTEFNRRIGEAFAALAERLGEDGSALVFTHGGAIWSRASQHWGLPFPNRHMSSVLNASMTSFEYRFDAWRLASYNEAGHLGRGLVDLEDGERLITLVRHGETDANVRQVWQGQADWGLNDHGRLQAQQLAEWFGPAGTLVSSPLGRAMETATVLNGSEPHTHAGLMEMSMGQWENLGIDAIRDGWPELFGAIYRGDEDRKRGETGESVGELFDRMEATMAELLDARDGNLTIVSHGSAIRAYVVSVLGGGYERFRATGLLPNTGIAEVVAGARPRLHSYGVAPHLTG